MKRIFGFLAVLAVLAIFTVPAMAQNKDLGPELNVIYGQGGITASGTGFPKSTAFGANFAAPLFQSDRFAVRLTIGFTHTSSDSLASDFGSVRASQTGVMQGFMVSLRPKTMLEPYGCFEQGFVGNKLSVGGQSQTRNAYGMGICGGFRLNLGKVSLGPRIGTTFSSAYGYDQYGNIQRQGTRSIQYLIDFAWHFGK